MLRSAPLKCGGYNVLGKTAINWCPRHGPVLPQGVRGEIRGIVWELASDRVALALLTWVLNPGRFGKAVSGESRSSIITQIRRPWLGSVASRRTISDCIYFEPLLAMDASA